MIHEHIKTNLISFIENKRVPHIIFYGPHGSGKRKVLDFFINSIYSNNKQTIKRFVMHVDCAHGKGIRFIRDELKFFAKTNIQNRKGRIFKSIILFNADQLTTDAQSALRRCIELFSHTTRFFIVITNKNGLLIPILSRFCSIYIPLPVIDGQATNLYKYKKTQVFRKKNEKREKWLFSAFKNSKNYSSLLKCYKFSIKLYENGYCFLDLFKVIDKTMNRKRKYSLLLYFDKIKKEFRNEKLLLFYIVYISFMRPDYNLEI